MVIKFRRLVRSWGKSKIITVPTEVMRAMKLKTSDELDLHMQEDKLIIEKVTLPEDPEGSITLLRIEKGVDGLIQCVVENEFGSTGWVPSKKLYDALNEELKAHSEKSDDPLFDGLAETVKMAYDEFCTGIEDPSLIYDDEE